MTDNQNNSRAFSSLVVDGMERAPSRAMLHAVGFTNADFKKPQIGIASTWSMVTPCNMHINRLADDAARGVNNANGKAVIFNTITISDGISMGTEGMKYSLVSREVIADSIETVIGCQGFDGVVAIGGCDKNMPGCMIAIARLNRPAIFVYGGTILPGCHKDKKLDVVSVFEAVGARANNLIDDAELAEIEAKAIPGAGSCGVLYIRESSLKKVDPSCVREVYNDLNQNGHQLKCAAARKMVDKWAKEHPLAEQPLKKLEDLLLAFKRDSAMGGKGK